MRKLLNTIYITKENAYLALDGETMVCRMEEDEVFRIPFDNVEAVVCFSYLGCSPALMGKCAENLVPITFLSPQGRFLAKIKGETRGNVLLRVSQIDVFRDKGIALAQNQIAAKLSNTISLIKRSMHDNQELREDAGLLKTLSALKDGINEVYAAEDFDSILGIEGSCAKSYFSNFSKLILNDAFTFSGRTKYPPLDEVNAVLSFVYTIYTNEYGAALETVGLDSYIGFYHTLRSGRKSLACDLVEETRYIAERFVLTLINLAVLCRKDFEYQISGAVYLTNEGRKKVITKWQEKKRSDIVHPYLEQKIQFGLIPYVQSNLLAKYVRGEIEEYPCYLAR